MFRSKGKISVLLLLALLVAMPLVQLPMPPQAAAQSSSCSSAQTLNVTLNGGTPNSFNMLTAATFSAFIPDLSMYPGVYGVITPTGYVDENQSVTDWVSSNSNFTQWEFNVAPGLKWSNGSAITSQDIANVYSSGFGLNVAVAAPFPFYHEITGVTTPNSSLAVFKLNASDAWLPGEISTPLFTDMFPSSFVSQGPLFSGFGVPNEVTEGPFYPAGYQTGQTQALFYRNSYFKPEANWCAVQVNFVETDSSTPTYLAAGTTDLAPVEPQSIAVLLTKPNLHLIDQKSEEEVLLQYNVTSYPFSQLAFRQALAYGINQTQIQQQAFAGYDTVAYNAEGETPAVDTQWYNSNQMTYSYNPSKALSLLSSIGINQNTSCSPSCSPPYPLTYSNGTVVTLPMFYQTEYASNTDAAGIIQQNLQALGFSVNLIGVTLGTAIGYSYSDYLNFDHSMFLGLTVGPMFGYPYTQTNPLCIGNILPFNCNAPDQKGITLWEGGPNSPAELQYDANKTALDATNNPAQVAKYFNNIQSINAQNLPDLVVGFPDSTWVYSTARFTNWPTNLMLTSSNINNTALAQITPISLSTSSSNNTYIYVAAGVIAAIIIIGGSAFYLRGRRKRP